MRLDDRHEAVGRIDMAREWMFYRHKEQMTTVKENTLSHMDIANDTRDRTEYGWLRRLISQHATMLFVLNARLYETVGIFLISL